MTSSEPAPSAAARLTALAEPIRGRLYEFVVSQTGPVRRDDAAEATGISRTLAAYHLDRLVDAGLLTNSYARPSGRSGPGAGRPAKLYERAPTEISLTVPPRSYDLLAGLLAAAVDADDTGAVTAALLDAAERDGRTGTANPDLETALRDRGYEPRTTATGDIELANCPFHRIARAHTALVCGLNEALLRGVSTAAGHDPDRVELCPGDHRCCVVIHAEPRENAG